MPSKFKKAGEFDHFVLHVEALEEIGKHIDKSKHAYDTALKRFQLTRQPG